MEEHQTCGMTNVTFDMDGMQEGGIAVIFQRHRYIHSYNAQTIDLRFCWLGSFFVGCVWGQVRRTATLLVYIRDLSRERD